MLKRDSVAMLQSTAEGCELQPQNLVINNLLVCLTHYQLDLQLRAAQLEECCFMVAVVRRCADSWLCYAGMPVQCCES
jgi:hypothetical protein